MRTLKETGLTSAPPFIKADQLAGRVFEVMGATKRDSQYGPEVIFTLRVLDDAVNGPWSYNADGEPVYICSWSAAETPSRKKYVDWFALAGADTLGPCAIEWVQTSAPNPFANIVDADWTEGETVAAASAPAIAAPAARPTVNTNGRARRQPQPAYAADPDDEVPF